MTTPNASPDKWTRLEKIVYLLDQWDAIFDPNTTAPIGSPGDGTGVPLMPRMASHPSILELSRCLSMLFIAAPGDYRHLKAHRCGCEWRIATIRKPRRLPNSKKVELVEVRMRQRIIPAWLDKERVGRGEQFLAERFRGEVFIPDELWDALHTPAVAA